MIVVDTVMSRCRRIAEDTFSPVTAKSASDESTTRSELLGFATLLVIKAKTTCP
jgi:hypothetical protein